MKSQNPYCQEIFSDPDIAVFRGDVTKMSAAMEGLSAHPWMADWSQGASTL
jgi:hypothetical protein